MKSTAVESTRFLADDLTSQLNTVYSLLEGMSEQPLIKDTSISVQERAASMKTYADAFGSVSYTHLQTRTSLIAVKLGLTGFILPFFFLNNPLLLYSSANPALATLWAFATACLGVSALAAGLQGWLFGPCNSVMRGLLLVAAFLAIDPGLKTDLAALALCAVAGVWSWKERGKG